MFLFFLKNMQILFANMGAEKCISNWRFDDPSSVWFFMFCCQYLSATAQKEIL